MFESPRDTGEVFEEMLKRGVIIRPLTSFGLPLCMRVNVGTDAENKAFIKALGEVLNG